MIIVYYDGYNILSVNSDNISKIFVGEGMYVNMILRNENEEEVIFDPDIVVSYDFSTGFQIRDMQIRHDLCYAVLEHLIANWTSDNVIRLDDKNIAEQLGIKINHELANRSL